MKVLPAILACGILSLASCAGPPALSDSWRDPAVREFAPQRTLVIAMSGEDSFRRVAEDELVRQIAWGQSQASYATLASGDMQDAAKARDQARAQGFDGALVMRVLEVDSVEQHGPGVYAPMFVTFTGQHVGTAWVWPTWYDAGYSYTEKTFRVETNLYSLADDKLVWSGVVRVRDPGSVKELTTLNAQAVLPELRRLKFLR